MHCERASFTIISIPLIILAATVLISVLVSEDVLARNNGKYLGDTTSQAAAVDNSCLNPIIDSNTIDNVVGVGNCGSTISQQDESGSASTPITHQTANPIIELQRATTTQPPLTGPPTTQGCEGCFDVLPATQQSAFETEIPGEFPGLSTIEQLCAHLVNLIISEENPAEALQNINEILGRLQETGHISSAAHSAINACLSRLG
jgi:hypothetical protein